MQGVRLWVFCGGDGRVLPPAGRRRPVIPRGESSMAIYIVAGFVPPIATTLNDNDSGAKWQMTTDVGYT